MSRRDGPVDPDFFALRGRRSSMNVVNPSAIAGGNRDLLPVLAEELGVVVEEEEERRAIARMLMAMYNESLKREEARRRRVRRDGKNGGKLPASIENFLAQRG